MTEKKKPYPEIVYTLSVSQDDFTYCIKCKNPLRRGVVIAHDDHWNDLCVCEKCVVVFAKILGVIPHD